MDAATVDISMIGNKIISSPGSHILYNVYTKSHTNSLRKWLLHTVRRAQSKRQSLPPNMGLSDLSAAIMQNSNFQSCIEQKAHTLVLSGDMGSGKSTTMCCFIRELENRQDIAVASILFDAETPNEQDVCKILIRFIEQLADLTNKAHYETVLSMYQRYPDTCPPAQQTVDALIAILNGAFEKQEKTCQKGTCFVLDGLDEFQNHQALHQLLGYLKKIQSQTKCGIIMSSRISIASVSTFFNSHSRQNITTHPTDVENFINSSLPSHVAQGLLENDLYLRKRVRDVVMESSHGL